MRNENAGAGAGDAHPQIAALDFYFGKPGIAQDGREFAHEFRF
jgi:hypothetical protein